MHSHLLHVISTIIRHHWLELGGLFTLGVSLWVAFGPMRHRLPPMVTRIGKYSATLKLLSISGFCSFLLYKCLTDDEPSLALNWLLGSLALVFFAGAVWVFTRKQTVAPPSAPTPTSGARGLPVVKLPRATSAGDAPAR